MRGFGSKSAASFVVRSHVVPSFWLRRRSDRRARCPPPPQRRILLDRESQDTVAIHDCFDGDEKAQMVVLGWSEGYRGAELREFVDVDQAALDYAIKRIRRTMTKRYPHGWKKQ